MGYRIVSVTSELFSVFLTKGCRWPWKDGTKLTVVQGIPADAKFDGGSYDFERDVLLLRYSHPSWGEVKPGENIPFFEVEHSTRPEDWEAAT